MGKKANIAAAVEAIGFSVKFETQQGKKGPEKYAEFRGFTNRGRELNIVVFYKSLDELFDNLLDRYGDFDVGEEVKLYLDASRNGLSGVPTLLDLVDDVREEEALLLDLSNAVAAGLAGRLPEPKKTWMEKEHEFDAKLSDAYSDPSCPLTEAAMQKLDEILSSIYGKSLRGLLRQ